MADGIEVGRAHVAVGADGKAAVANVARDFSRAMPQIGRNAGRSLSSGLFASVKTGSRGAAASIGFVAKGAGGLALALGAAAGAGGALGLKTAASMEQAKISFETMLGSATKADKFLKNLADFAAKTPFEFPELQTAASSLISAGIQANKVIPIMTTLGDVTSGMGTGSEGIKRATIALQQMQAAGRITGEDLNQLRDAGIPVYDLLAKATGKSKEEVIKLAQAGKLGKKELDAMMKALETGKGLERFTGLMDKQSQSLTGMFSTFKDVLGQGLAKAIQPLIPTIKSLLGVSTTLIGVVLKPLPGFFKTVSLSVRAFFAAFREGDVTSNGVVGVFERLGVAARAIVPQIRQVVAAVVPVLMPALRTLGNILVNVVLPAWIKWQTFMAGNFLAVIRTIAPIIAEIVRAIVGKFQQMRPQIMSIWNSVKEIITGVMFIIREVISSVTHIIQMIWARWGNQIKAVVVTVFGALINIISGVMKVIAGIIKLVVALIKGDWRGAWNAIKQIFAGVWQAIKGILTAVTAVLRQVIIAWLAKIRSLWTAGFNAVRTFTRNLMESIRSSISDVLSRVRDRFASAVTAIGNAWDKLKAAAKKPIDFVVRTVLNNGLIDAFNWVAGKVGASGIKKIPWPPGGWYGGGPTAKAASDRSVAGLVHANEHVVTADEVRRAGGHAAWERLRAMARTGALRALPGFFLGGAAPVSGGSRRHSGYPWARWAGDFSAGTGTPVHSWNPGTVAAVKNWNYSYGHHVRVNHPGNVQTLYAHLRNAIVRVGQSVRRNQVLGYSDSTGNSTGPHLHFELKGGHGVLGGATGSGAVQAVVDWVAKLKDKIKGPLGRLKELGSSPFAEIVKTFPRKIADAMLEKAKSFTSDIPGLGALSGISAKGGNRALGRRMMVAAGWGLAQWPFLERLWTRESGWRTTARNPSSGAYGIPQSLPGSKMASAGGDWRTNPATQIRWGLGYIKSRYGSPLKAWGHSQRTGWYANGTLNAAPGWARVGERGPEWVNFRGGEQVLPNGQTPGGSGGVTINGGQFGYDPKSIAREILKEQRHQEALNPVFG